MDEFPNLADMAFDGILALAVLVLAWKLLRSPNLFKAVVLFISFGLMMSLAWVRLKAVDIALAEAAIGAGLTGALFLTALGKLQRGAQHNQENNGTPQQSQEGRPNSASGSSD
jgi:energy-converting hydrogenase B subunit D